MQCRLCQIHLIPEPWFLNPDHWSANFRKLKDFYEAEGSTYISTETLPVGFRNKLCLYFLKISKQICPKVCGPDGYHAVVQPNPFHPGRGYCSDLWVLFWSEKLYFILSQIFSNTFVHFTDWEIVWRILAALTLKWTASVLLWETGFCRINNL